VGFIPLAIGSQLPDLIDKPQVYYGVIASGRLGRSFTPASTVLLGFVAWLGHCRVGGSRAGGYGGVRLTQVTAFAIRLDDLAT
jgi:hypothetical protein